MALTYANQIGAISGLNQSGSGVSIPEGFVRWGQDILFDRKILHCHFLSHKYCNL